MSDTFAIARSPTGQLEMRTRACEKTPVGWVGRRLVVPMNSRHLMAPSLLNSAFPSVGRHRKASTSIEEADMAGQLRVMALHRGSPVVSSALPPPPCHLEDGW